MVVLTVKKGECVKIGQAVQLIIENIENDVVDFAIQNSGSMIVEKEEIVWQHKKESLKASFSLPKFPQDTSPSKKRP